MHLAPAAATALKRVYDWIQTCTLASEVDAARDTYWGPYARQARQRLDKLYRDLRRPLPKKDTHAPRDLSHAMTPALALMATLARHALAQSEIICLIILSLHLLTFAFTFFFYIISLLKLLISLYDMLSGSRLLTLLFQEF